MATSPFSEASYCNVLVPRPTHKRGRQGVAHYREPVERAAFRGSDGLVPPKSVTVSEFHHERFNVLSTRAREAGLTPSEQEELDEYIETADILAIVQSKARQALKALAWLLSDGSKPCSGQPSSVQHLRDPVRHIFSGDSAFRSGSGGAGFAFASPLTFRSRLRFACSRSCIERVLFPY